MRLFSTHALLALASFATASPIHLESHHMVATTASPIPAFLSLVLRRLFPAATQVPIIASPAGDRSSVPLKQELGKVLQTFSSLLGNNSAAKIAGPQKRTNMGAIDNGTAAISEIVPLVARIISRFNSGGASASAAPSTRDFAAGPMNIAQHDLITIADNAVNKAMLPLNDTSNNTNQESASA
ncbi:hypothetical protein DL89DRAFT_281356 [Linderina pennispora]|uniref:Uncharacterized protein n=1 Tax=Linderina pennispora TaxID=61395 RepID=A0A1Y1WGE4_9FUNG|nr:uncharacterized protein DL89DRAFT_281356 [Linderina pennispora]ORX72620.1 hypothetical protein DL89DRAFT_281356 [Linderina pennispora]